MGYSNWNLLCHVDNFTAGAGPSLSTPAFDPLLLLKILIRVAGYSASSVARLRFNGDSGTTNYSYSVSENFSAPTTSTSGTASGVNLATTTGSSQSDIEVVILNSAGIEKGIFWQGVCNSLVAGTAPAILLGSGIWANTAVAVNQITLDAGTGGGNLNAGTGISVFGCNAT
jgi:hypothetical protein